MLAEVERAIAALPPVSLAELEARAALRVRTDRKYVVESTRLADGLARLGGAYGALELDDGGRAFRYDTVYFDTPDAASYRAHLQGRRRRFKCRTRDYVDAGRCAFEVKLKDGRGRTVKRTVPVDPAEHGALGDAALAFLEQVLRSEYGHLPPAPLAATLRTSFTRLTLVGLAATERATVDVGLVLQAARGRPARLLPGRILVETKTSHGNGLVDRALRAAGARPVGPCSKYCIGVALADPGVRRNRFARVIREHFEPAREIAAAA